MDAKYLTKPTCITENILPEVRFFTVGDCLVCVQEVYMYKLKIIERRKRIKTRGKNEIDEWRTDIDINTSDHRLRQGGRPILILRRRKRADIMEGSDMELLINKRE